MDKSLVTLLARPSLMDFQIKHLSKSLHLLIDLDEANDLQFPICNNQDVSEE